MQDKITSAELQTQLKWAIDNGDKEKENSIRLQLANLSLSELPDSENSDKGTSNNDLSLPEWLLFDDTML